MKGAGACMGLGAEEGAKAPSLERKAWGSLPDAGAGGAPGAAWLMKSDRGETHLASLRELHWVWEWEKPLLSQYS